MMMQGADAPSVRVALDLRRTARAPDAAERSVFREGEAISPSADPSCPKEAGKTRPIGVEAFEEKLVHDGVREVLEAIYEQDILDCSCASGPGAALMTPCKLST